MSKVVFCPFIGVNYDKEFLDKRKRIMILGESHYTNDVSDLESDISHKNKMTEAIVEKYLKREEHEGWMNTFLKFERSLVGYRTERDDSNKIWNSVVFYNYLQEFLSGPRKSGTDEQYRKAEDPFFEILEKNRPEYVIVWGKRLYDRMPCTGWEDRPNIIVDGKETANGIYAQYNVKVMAVNHPSSAYSWSYWHKVICSFLNETSDGCKKVFDLM